MNTLLLLLLLLLMYNITTGMCGNVLFGIVCTNAPVFPDFIFNNVCLHIICRGPCCFGLGRHIVFFEGILLLHCLQYVSLSQRICLGWTLDTIVTNPSWVTVYIIAFVSKHYRCHF